MSELKIIEEKENPLFKRKELKLETSADIAPKYTDVLDMIAKQFSAQPETIKVKQILGSFGSNIFTITANIYNSKEEKEELEIKKKRETELEKKAAEEANAKEAAQVEEKAKEPIAETSEEESSEENKEEPKEENGRKEEEIKQEGKETTQE